MDRLADIVTRYAAVVLGLSVLLTVFAVSRIVDLQTGERYLALDPSVDRLIPDFRRMHRMGARLNRITAKS